MNFPSPATENQEFTPVVGGPTYIYKAPRWIVKGSPAVAPTLIVTSDGPPASPTDNLLWWETDTGKMFIYFNDGNTRQWIAVM